MAQFLDATDKRTAYCAELSEKNVGERVCVMGWVQRQYKNDLDRIGNSLSYAERLPADYIGILLKNYEAMEEDYQKKLMQIPEYTRLLSKRGVVRNGSV